MIAVELMRTNLISVLTLIGLLVLPYQPALANLFVYEAPTKEESGKFTGELSLDKIARLLLPKGTISFEGDQVKIRAVPRWLFDRNLVLQGTVVRAEFVSKANICLVGGLIYFYQGLWLEGLGRQKTTDLIDTIDGVQWKGRIVGCDGQNFQLRENGGKMQKIAFANIRSIKSPRAFAFNLNCGGAMPENKDKAISFNASQIILKQSEERYALLASKNALVPKSNLSGTEFALSKAALTYFVAFDIMSIIAPAIVIPLVINRRNTGAATAEYNKSLLAAPHSVN